MATETIGTKGAELDILIRQGATFGPNSIQLRSADGNPLNLTGATLRGQIRKTPDDDALQAEFDFTITNASDGMVTWELPASDSEFIFAAPTDEEDPLSLYVYDCEVQMSTGKVMPLLYGNVKLFREVTKV